MRLDRARVFELAKGFRGRAKNVWRISRMQVEKALQHAYRGRKEKKRDFRSLWIQRVNAGVREHGLSYSHFIGGLASANIQLNRRALSDLAMSEPFSFKALADQVKHMRGLTASGSSQAASAGAGAPPKQQGSGARAKASAS